MFPFTIVSRISKGQFVVLQLGRYFRRKSIVVLSVLCIAWALLTCLLTTNIFATFHNWMYLMLFIWAICPLLVVINTLVFYKVAKLGNITSYIFSEDGIQSIVESVSKRLYTWQNIRSIVYKGKYLFIQSTGYGGATIRKDKFTADEIDLILQKVQIGPKLLVGGAAPSFIKKFKICNSLVVAVLGCIVFIFFNSKITKRESGKNLTKNLPADYVSLLSTDYLQSDYLQLDYEKRKNVLVILLSPDKYGLVIYKIGKSADVLSSIIKMRNRGTNIVDTSIPSNNIKYHDAYFCPYYRFVVANDSISNAGSIYLSLNGDSLTTNVINDSTICYNLQLNSLSMKYTTDGAIDVQIQRMYTEKLQLFNVMLLKRHGDIYFLTLCPQNEKVPMAANTICGMVNL